jgi:hypothetical protein
MASFLIVPAIGSVLTSLETMFLVGAPQITTGTAIVLDQYENGGTGAGVPSGAVIGASKSVTTLEGDVAANFKRFVSKIPANSKASASAEALEDGNFLFSATSPGKVPGSSALYQKWVNPQGETFNMLKTTFAPDGSIIHIKPKL